MHFEPATDALSTPVAWADTDGLILGLNPAFARWLGGPLQAQVEARLAMLEGSGLLRPGAGQAVYQDYRQGRVHWSRPWALVALAAVAQ